MSGARCSGDPARRHGLVAAGRRLVLLAASAAIAACGTVPAENFYTLSAVAVSARPAPAGPASGYTFVVEPATVPELVDRPQFVIGVGDSRVALLEQQRWAEPLKSQISRTVAINLGRLLGSARVSTYAQAVAGDGGDSDYRVTLDVQRFEAVPGDAVALEIVWTVRRARALAPNERPAQDKSGRAVVREKTGTGGYSAVVAAHDRALAAVSREIAGAIEQ